MAAIWMNTAEGKWEVLSPANFSLEAHLQSLVFQSVEMLPLSGSPVLVALAREVEVPVSKGRVDIVAMEATGTPVLVEVKLKANTEARKAVVAQILSYAASLRGISLTAFTTRLTSAGFSAPSIAEAMLDTGIDENQFAEALIGNLSQGRFRLVLVLDDVPPELVLLVGYIEAISGGLLAIDLVTITTFKVGDLTVAVPQRIDPAHYSPPPSLSVKSSTNPPVISELGAQLFESATEQAPPAHQPALREMADWARSLAAEGVVSLVSRQGARRTVLTVRVKNEDSGMASLWNDSGQPYLWIHGTVLGRRAPLAGAKLQSLFGQEAGFRKAIKWADVTKELLEALRDGYREAARS